MTRLMRAVVRQRPSDSVTILFLSFLLILTGVTYELLPRPFFLISLYTVLLVLQIVFAKDRRTGKFPGILHGLIFPAICIIAIFDSLEWVVHFINPRDIDPVLIRLDYFMFGDHPTVLLERIMHPLLTDLLQIAYTTYYCIPIVYGAILLSQGAKDAFDRSFFLIVFCFYLSYLGYMLFPAIGPRFTLEHLQTRELQGFLFAEPLQDLLNRLEGIKRDAFPSGHTAVTAVVLYCAYYFERRFFRFCMPVVIALIFSTVYCRYHYVVDVVAGLVLAGIVVVAGERYYDWWVRQQRDRAR